MAKNLSVYTIKPLGVQLVEAGLITQAQLQQALGLQKQSADKLLGQVLIEIGALDEGTFQAFMQARTTIHQPLGELLVRIGHISQAQLEQALSIQLQSQQTRPLGQVLVEMEAISKGRLDAILQIQHMEREKMLETMQVTPSARETQLIIPTREQVEDIQGLLGVGHLLFILSKALIPDASPLEKRFYIFHELYGNLSGQLPVPLLPAITDFFIHFLPLLEWTPEETGYAAVLDASFLRLLQGLQRLLQDERPVAGSYQLSSLVANGPAVPVSLREALHRVTRSPELLPHPSLQTLRFLFNEFWGQRSILEQQGVKIVRQKDDVALDDFFRAQLGDIQADLAYMQRMEQHIFHQIDRTSQGLTTASDRQLESGLRDLVEFYRTLLQTDREWRELAAQREPAD